MTNQPNPESPSSSLEILAGELERAMSPKNGEQAWPYAIAELVETNLPLIINALRSSSRMERMEGALRRIVEFDDNNECLPTRLVEGARATLQGAK